MTAFRIAGFSGLVPRLAKQLLAPNQPQVATNCDLTSGAASRNGPLLVAPLDIEEHCFVARSPVAGNTSRRFYYTGDGEPHVSDYDTATQGVGHPPPVAMCWGLLLPFPLQP